MLWDSWAIGVFDELFDRKVFLRWATGDITVEIESSPSCGDLGEDGFVLLIERMLD